MTLLLFNLYTFKWLFNLNLMLWVGVLLLLLVFGGVGGGFCLCFLTSILCITPKGKF